MKKYSIKDIAEMLGVSKTLVSLVLNNKGDQYGINKETQKKVIETAMKLKYRPNRLAQGLRLGKTKSLGLVVPDISNPFYSRIAKYTENLVSQAGYSLIICDTDEDEKKEGKIIETLIERNVDGLIIASTSLNVSEIKKFEEENIPFVLIDRQFKEIECNYIGVDNYQGTYNAIKHLIHNNFKRTAFISVTPEHISTLEERKQGYLDALENSEIEKDDEIIITLPYNDIENAARKELCKLFKMKNPPDSLFLANYKLTIEVLKSIKYNSFKFPDNFKIFAFDDFPLFDIFQLPISTISQPIEKMCQKTVDILLEEVNSDSDKQVEKKKVILSTNIILR